MPRCFFPGDLSLKKIGFDWVLGLKPHLRLQAKLYGHVWKLLQIGVCYGNADVALSIAAEVLCYYLLVFAGVARWHEDRHPEGAPWRCHCLTSVSQRPGSPLLCWAWGHHGAKAGWAAGCRQLPWALHSQPFWCRWCFRWVWWWEDEFHVRHWQHKHIRYSRGSRLGWTWPSPDTWWDLEQLVFPACLSLKTWRLSLLLVQLEASFFLTVVLNSNPGRWGLRRWNPSHGDNHDLANSNVLPDSVPLNLPLEETIGGCSRLYVLYPANSWFKHNLPRVNIKGRGSEVRSLWAHLSGCDFPSSVFGSSCRERPLIRCVSQLRVVLAQTEGFEQHWGAACSEVPSVRPLSRRSIHLGMGVWVERNLCRGLRAVPIRGFTAQVQTTKDAFLTSTQ